MAIARTDHGTVTSWSVSGSDRTVSGSVVGAVASDCIVVVYVGHERGSVQSATIGGVTANVVSDVYSVLGTAIVWAEVPAGTVPDTVLTFDVTNASFPIVGFSTVTGMSATAYADNSGGANGTSVSTTLDIPANGAAFSIAYLRTGGSAAWTGLTEVDEENGTLNGRSGTTANDTGMSLETGRSISVTWGAAHVTSLTAVSFEEASGGGGAAQTVTGSAFDGSAGFGSGTVTQIAPVQTITGAAVAAQSGFGDGAVSTSYTITGAAFDGAAQFGAGVVSTSTQVTGAAIPSALGFGSGTVSAQAAPQTVTGQAIPSAAGFGSGVVSVDGGPVTIVGSAIQSGVGFGAGEVTTLTTIGGASIPSTVGFGAGSVKSASVITGSAVPSVLGFGAGVVSIGPATIHGATIASTLGFGSGVVQRSGLLDTLPPLERSISVAARQSNIDAPARCRTKSVAGRSRTR